MDRLGWESRVGRVAATGQFVGRGNGYVVPVIAKTDFSLDARAGGGVQDIPLATGIDSSSWVSAVLAVRVHAHNTWTGTVSLNVFVDNIALVAEEPDVVFVGSQPAVINYTQSIAAAPFLSLASLTTPIGSLLRVRLSYSASAAQSGANTISLGIDLIGRPA
jgi:hypothetical protein